MNKTEYKYEQQQISKQNLLKQQILKLRTVTIAYWVMCARPQTTENCRYWLWVKYILFGFQILTEYKYYLVTIIRKLFEHRIIRSLWSCNINYIDIVTQSDTCNINCTNELSENLRSCVAWIDIEQTIINTRASSGAKNDRRNSGGTLRQKIFQKYPQNIL